MSKETTAEIKADILIVDDTPENLRLLNQILSQYYKVRLAPSGSIALSAARSAPPDLILLDIMMPSMNGFEVASRLKADPLTGDIPIIFMSALDDTANKVRGFAEGGIDYVTKPFQEVEVLARVRTHMSMRALYKQAQAEIIERKKGETELRESESRIRALLSAVPDTMVRIYRDGVILDFKASANELLFSSLAHKVGVSLREILDHSLADKFMNCIEKTLECKEIQTLEYSLKKDDSSHVFEARFKDSGIDEVTVIIRDVTGWVRLEQMKSDFINRASHELRTPIATILLMISLMEGDGIPEVSKEYWDVLKDQIHRERMLIENLLNVGRMESGQINLRFTPVDILSLLNNVIYQFEAAAKDKNILINRQMLPEPHGHVFISADENAITQAFINLLGNAIKFTPQDGNVTVTMKQESDGVEVSFVDTGIGIPSEDIPLLFNRFFRGTNAIEHEIPGTGIGLFLVRSIIEKHNGSIKLHSEVDKGSEITVWIPAAQPA